MRRWAAGSLLCVLVLGGCGFSGKGKEVTNEQAEAEATDPVIEWLDVKQAELRDIEINVDMAAAKAERLAADLEARLADPSSESRIQIQKMEVPGAFPPNLAKASFEAYQLRRHSFLSDIAFANGLFVAIGENGTLLTSPDGKEWAVQPAITIKDLTELAFGNGRFVAVGEDGLIISSSDGLSWSHVRAGVGNSTSITFHDGKFVTSGSESVFVSEDGQNWSSSDVTNVSLRLTAAVHNQGRILAQEGADAILHVFEQGAWKLVDGRTHHEGGDLQYANGVFARAILDTGTVEVSADGAKWKSYSTGLAKLQRLRVADGQLVALGDGSLATSDNGIKWKTFSTGTTTKLHGIAFGNGHWVAVGDDGLILVAGSSF